jgi:polar amino acid transport system substrate-binding protein
MLIKWIKLSWVVLAMGMIASLSSQEAKAGGLEEILRSGKIRIAIPQDSPPFGSLSPSGTFDGYDVEVAKLIAKDLDVKVELVPVVSKNRIPFLTTKKVDLVISSMGANPKRAMTINFSKAYAPFFWGVFGPKKITVKNAADTLGYRVGATLGTLEELAFTEAAPKGVTIKRYDDQATTAAAFLSGHVDLLVTGSAIAAKLIKDNASKMIETKFIMRQSPCHIGVRKSETDLLNWVNVFIYSHKLNGDLDKLSVKWFGEPLPEFPQF